MTILEKFREFTNRHLGDKHTAKYFLEDVDQSILATFTDKQVKFAVDGDGDDTTKIIKYKDITKLEFYNERPKDDPIVKSGQTLLIQSAKQTVVISCLTYDWGYIEPIVTAGMTENEENDDV